MRIRRFFTVAEGEKVTEKVFTRVLLSSVCSMLLCMACLAGTTWAWFTVSLENTGNVIQIASMTLDVTVYKIIENTAVETVTTDDADVVDVEDTDKSVVEKSEDGSYYLDAGTYSIVMRLEGDDVEADDLGKSMGNAYVVMMITEREEPESYYMAMEGTVGKEVTMKLPEDSGTVKVSFDVSWVEPVAAHLYDPALFVMEEPTQESIEESTEMTTGESMEMTTEESTEMTTEESEETPAESTTESSAEETTGPPAQSTEETTEAPTEITESEAESTEDTTEGTTETTMESTAESTESMTEAASTEASTEGTAEDGSEETVA